MKDDTLFNVLVGVVIVTICLLLILIFSSSTSDSYTELYFEDPEDLPTELVQGETIDFSFSIHSFENQEMLYEYTVYIEYYNSLDKVTSEETINEDTITLNHNEISITTQKLTISEDADHAKVTIQANDEQTYFWLWRAEWTLYSLFSALY